ncbi:MAG: hypothetical protein WCT05_03640 [Lentisphaeria bacterium]
MNNKRGLENLIIDTRNGEPHSLRDVASVERAVELRKFRVKIR